MLRILASGQPLLPEQFRSIVAADQQVPVEGDADRDEAVELEVEPAQQVDEVTKLGHAPDFPEHHSFNYDIREIQRQRIKTLERERTFLLSRFVSW